MTKRVRIIIAATAPCIAIAAFALKKYLIGMTAYFPECYFHKRTGLSCPGCGNTRSVIALLNGDILRAVRCNPTVPFLSLLLILLYAEVVCGIFGRKVKLLPRKQWIWWIVIALIMIYLFVRNFVPCLIPPP